MNSMVFKSSLGTTPTMPAGMTSAISFWLASVESKLTKKENFSLVFGICFEGRLGGVLSAHSVTSAGFLAISAYEKAFLGAPLTLEAISALYSTVSLLV